MIGFLVQEGSDQSMINSINMLAREKPCIVFSETAMPQLQCNVLQKLEAFHFNGHMITSDLRLCQQLANLGYTKKRYLYIKDYIWNYMPELHLSQLEDTLLNEHIDLIVNDYQQMKIVSEITNKIPKYIMNDWDINILRSIGNE
jgi:hypothetical protein